MGGEDFSRYRGKQSVPPPAPISRTNREGPPLMPGTIHVHVPDSLQAYRTLHIRPGGRIEVLLRSGVRMEYSQSSPGVLMETAARAERASG